MALIKDPVLESEIFEDALRQVCFFFQIEKLYEDQVSAIKSVLKGDGVSSVQVLVMENLSCFSVFLC